MTSITNANSNKLESLYAEKDAYEKGIASSKKTGLDTRRQEKYLAIVQSEIDELLASQSLPPLPKEVKEKKNESTAESTKEAKPPKTDPRAEHLSSSGVSVTTVSADISIDLDFKRVEDEKYFFVSEEAAKKFQYYNRHRLRSKLLSWQKKQNKNKENQEMMFLIVSYFLAQISGVISDYAKPEYKEILSKKTYSVGDKTTDKKYSFNMEKLREDFGF